MPLPLGTAADKRSRLSPARQARVVHTGWPTCVVSTGGERAVELSGVLQLVRQSHHLQQHVQGVPRRVPRRLPLSTGGRSRRPLRVDTAAGGGQSGRRGRQHGDVSASIDGRPSFGRQLHDRSLAVAVAFTVPRHRARQTGRLQLHAPVAALPPRRRRRIPSHAEHHAKFLTLLVLCRPICTRTVNGHTVPVNGHTQQNW